MNSYPLCPVDPSPLTRSRHALIDLPCSHGLPCHRAALLSIVRPKVLHLSCIKPSMHAQSSPTPPKPAPHSRAIVVRALILADEICEVGLRHRIIGKSQLA